MSFVAFACNPLELTLERSAQNAHSKRLMCAEGTPDCGKGTIWEGGEQHFGMPPPGLLNERLSMLDKRLVVSEGGADLEKLCAGGRCDGLFGLPVAQEKRSLPLRISRFGSENSLCDAIGGCDGNLNTPGKRFVPFGKPVGDENSICDAIGGCDGNLWTPQKRTEPGFISVNVADLPKINVGDIIGLGPQVEEKREALNYGLCSGDSACGNIDDKRSAAAEKPGFLTVDVNDLPKVEVGDLIGIGPEIEEKRDAQAELCVMPYGCRGDADDLPGRFRNFGPIVVGEEKREASNTLSVDVDDLGEPLTEAELCGFKGCGDVVLPQ